MVDHKVLDQDLWRMHLLPAGAIALYFMVIGCVIGVNGNFPVNDDWMYGSEVRNLLATGHLQILGGGPACAFHIVFGAVIAKCFGFSFVTLRVLTLCFGWTGCFALYEIILELRSSRKLALLGAAVLACNPLFVNLLFCYMTDVPALTYCLLFLFFLLRAAKTPSTLNLVASGTALVLAIQVRQNLAILITASLVFLLLRKMDKLTLAKACLFLLFMPIGSAVLADVVMKLVNTYPGAYDWYKHEIARLLNPRNWWETLLLESKSTAQALAYLGLFCAPVVVPAALQAWQQNRTSGQATAGEEIADDDSQQLAAIGGATKLCLLIVSAVFCVGEFAYLAFAQHRLMPFSRNLLLVPTLGPYTIIGAKFTATNDQAISLTIIAAMLATAALYLIAMFALGTIALVFRSFKSANLSSQINRPQGLTLAALYAVAFGTALALSIFHTSIANLDRYLLIGVALSVPLFVGFQSDKANLSLPLILLAVLGLYSVGAEHDYMSWNRARWQAISALAQRGTALSIIDGGTEFNYINDPTLSSNLTLAPNTFQSSHKGRPPLSNLREWSVNGEEFVISLEPVAGYSVECEFPYSTFFHPSTDKVYVLKTRPVQ